MLTKVDGYITSNWIDTRHKVDYQFGKILNEKGTLIFSDCFDSSAAGLHEFFAERAELYNTVAKHKNVTNIAKCFIISMPPGEYPDEDTFSKIGDKFLEKMGYAECPRILFQHHDTDKSHIHIIVSTITDELTHIDNGDDFEKCFEVGRQLEKEFGYSELKKKTFKRESFQEISSRRYYYQNALQKALRSNKSGEFSTLFSPDIRQRIMRQSLPNDLMNELLGNDMYDRVGEMLKSQNLFFKNFKQELLDRLETIHSHSEGKDFLKYAKESGIYVRHVKDTLIYGIADLSFYVNENTLPRKYHYKSLKENRTNFKLDSEQHQYIFESFCNSCYGTPDAFLKRLNDHRIIAEDPDGNLLALSKNMNFDFSEYIFLDTTAPDAHRVKGKELSAKLSGIKMKDIIDHKYAHEYKLSDDFHDPGSANDDRFSKTLKRALKSHAVKERLTNLIPEDVKQIMARYPLDTNQYKYLLSGTSFLAVSDILYKGGFFHTYYLEELKNKLDTIYEKTQGDRSQFLRSAEEIGIKIKLLKNQSFLFEIKGDEGSFRFKENRLPQKYRNESLNHKPGNTTYKLQEEQYKYIFDTIRDSLRGSITLAEVFSRLSDRGIQVYDNKLQPIDQKTGSPMLFGDCLFTDQNSTNPVYIPGKSISPSLSNQTLSNLVSKKLSNDYIQAHFPAANFPSVYVFPSVHAHYTPDDEFAKRKKKKRGIGDIGLND